MSKFDRRAEGGRGGVGYKKRSLGQTQKFNFESLSLVSYYRQNIRFFLSGQVLLNESSYIVNSP